MTKKINNKKGFTLTELIVVIVIIGILAAVLIPTLTGYIKKAKYSAAEQEALTFKTAFQAWEIETAGENQNLESFKKYCTELELVGSEEVDEFILYVDLTSKSYIVKASNGLYVQYENGKYTVTEKMPNVVPVDLESFYQLVIKNNIAYVNEGIKGIANLQIGEINDDGSASVTVTIENKNEKTIKVFAAVYEVIDLIIEAGGKDACITPVVENLNSADYFTLLNVPLENLDVNGDFYIQLSNTNINLLANYIAAALTYDNDKDYNVEANMNEWVSSAQKIIETDANLAPALSELLDKNTIKVVANIAPEGVEPYQVVYYFTFVE